MQTSNKIIQEETKNTDQNALIKLLSCMLCVLCVNDSPLTDGRVGSGGNARFPTFRLNHYGPTDGPTDGWTDGQMDGPTNGWTNKASYRVACPQLKMTFL